MKSKSEKFSTIQKLLNKEEYLYAIRLLSEIKSGNESHHEKLLKDYLYRKIPSKYKVVESTDSITADIAWPKITIVTPSYNQGKFIEETILSVLSQNYPNLEFFVIDGGSNDETLEVIKKYEKYIDYWVSEKDGGQSDAINKGFKRSKGDILTWLNSDDQFHQNALFSVALSFALEQKDLIVGICDVYNEGVKKKRHISSFGGDKLPIIDLLNLEGSWNKGEFFFQPEVFFSRRIWEISGAHVKTNLFYSMDYELWCRFAINNASVHRIGKSLIKFREHEEQKTSATDKFKAELISVKTQFIKDNKLEWKEGQESFFDLPLKILMINDNGFKYGAGIAHERIFLSLELAGHKVKVIALPVVRSKSADDAFWNEINLFGADFIIFGNLHSNININMDIYRKIMELDLFKFIVTHDFWAITGRCAYMLECKKYLEYCDDGCATYSEYPALPKELIGENYLVKQDILKNSSNVVFLCNSSWSHNVVTQWRNVKKYEHINVERIHLGLPNDKFKPQNKLENRYRLEFGEKDFLLLYSVSSLSEHRKGADKIKQILEKLNRPNITLVLLGNPDIEFNPKGVRVAKMGYVTDTSRLIEIMSICDVHISGSQEETFGQVFIEAAAVGLPSIGYMRTGILDAVKEGITGGLVLNELEFIKKIQMYYDDRSLIERLRFSTTLYANNEFTLEKMYLGMHGLFQKYISRDKDKYRAKIEFMPFHRLVNDDGNKFRCVYLKGISNKEGPYPPKYPFELNWCHSEESILEVFVPDNNESIILKVLNTIFNSQKIDIFVDDILYDKKVIPQFEVFEFKVDFVKAGWKKVIFKPSKLKEPVNQETRALAFMLIDVIND
jgi:glycosyltransferase involved in cell wall biosynthesis